MPLLCIKHMIEAEWICNQFWIENYSISEFSSPAYMGTSMYAGDGLGLGVSTRLKVICVKYFLGYAYLGQSYQNKARNTVNSVGRK